VPNAHNIYIVNELKKLFFIAIIGAVLSNGFFYFNI